MPKFRGSLAFNLHQSIKAPDAYMEFLKERNKQNLWEIITPSEPPIETPTYTTPEQDVSFKNIVKGLSKHGVNYIIQQTGLNRIPGGLLGVTRRNASRVQRSIEREFAGFFLPMQYLAQDIIHHYEALVAINPEMSALGSTVFGLLGGIVGQYYLGPVGANLLGYTGEVLGGMYGAYFEWSSPILKRAFSDIWKNIKKGFSWGGGDFTLFPTDDPTPPNITYTGPTVEESNVYRERSTLRKVLELENRMNQRLYY